MENITTVEAAKKICPFMSQKILSSGGNIVVAKYLCETKECMAWKQHESSETGKCLLIPNLNKFFY